MNTKEPLKKKESFRHWRQRRIARLLAWLLARDQYAPMRRLVVVVGLFALIWGFALFVEYPDVSPWVEAFVRPFGFGADSLIGALFTPPTRLFHPNLWRHLLVGVLALIVGLAGGARFLADIFELKSVGVAGEYLLASIFGGLYSSMEIKEGEVTGASKEAPVYLIGGPGYVKIHLGSAALFERVGGRSSVVGAARRHFLEGFERFREGVDLKNQHRALPDIDTFSKDGIPVSAKDVQAEFRILTDRPRSPQNPYPFSKWAVRRLVYGKSVTAESFENPDAYQWSAAVANRIGGLVRKHIESHLLDELIPIEETPPDETAAPAVAGVGRGASGASGGGAGMTSATASNPRGPLSASFYKPEAVEEFEKMGVEVLWVGVGTWKTPEEVSRAWMNEWVAKWRAEVRSSEEALEAQKIRGKGQTLANFVALIAIQVRNAESKGWNARELLRIMYKSLDAIANLVALSNGNRLPVGVDEALAHIEQLSEAEARFVGE